MTINERIIQAVTPVVPVCVPDFYDPNQNDAAEEFCVFSYSEEADFFADNRPLILRYEIVLQWAMPLKKNALTSKENLQKALLDAGFTIIDVVNVSDDVFQAYEFSLQYTEWLNGQEVQP